MCLLLSAPKITKIYAREGGGGVVPVEFGFFPAEYWACLIFFVVLQCLFDMHKRYYRVR